MEKTGYMHPLYAESLSDFGKPIQLPNSDSTFLLRNIPETSYYDLMGSYPLYFCNDWYGLEKDLQQLPNDIVSVAVVVNPFSTATPDLLQKIFVDKCLKYKAHYVAELDNNPLQFVSKHHRYYTKKVLEKVDVEWVENSLEFHAEWCNLYDELIQRHSLRGIKAFSRQSFIKQLSIPGTYISKAIYQDKTVAAHIWYIQDNIVYSHLAASNTDGYSLMAAYAIYWNALDYFSGKAKWIDFGAGAGIGSNTKDGLTLFKSGWTKLTKYTYFCGRIINLELYNEISTQKKTPPTSYFPKYRVGEFA